MRADLLKVMNTMKEKDRKNFYEINSDRTAWNIKLILYPFYNYFLKKTKGISSDEVFHQTYIHWKKHIKSYLWGNVI